MRWRLFTAVLLALAGCGWARGGQVTIENPKNLPIDAARVNLLYIMVCQEVAETFHIRDYKRLEYPLTLVLGEERERYVIDHSTGEGTIYLQQWDESRFTGSAVMVAFHQALSTEQFRLLVAKTLKRFWNASPVTVAEAKHRR
jgi:hypothetical protein